MCCNGAKAQPTLAALCREHLWVLEDQATDVRWFEDQSVAVLIGDGDVPCRVRAPLIPEVWNDPRCPLKTLRANIIGAFSRVRNLRVNWVTKA